MMSGGRHGSDLVAERLEAALNAHDIDAFVACYAEAYQSEQPAQGPSQARDAAQRFHGAKMIRPLFMANGLFFGICLGGRSG